MNWHTRLESSKTNKACDFNPLSHFPVKTTDRSSKTYGFSSKSKDHSTFSHDKKHSFGLRKLFLSLLQLLQQYGIAMQPFLCNDLFLFCWQWFGNEVTMKWWNDLWLNEGIATYLSYFAVDSVEPTFNIVSPALQYLWSSAKCSGKIV